MKSPRHAEAARSYPFMVTRGRRRLTRRTLWISNQPATERASPLRFNGPGLLDARGSLTPKGRKTVSARMSAWASTSRTDHCVVWGPEDCTWFERNGDERVGSVPPRATEVLDPRFAAVEQAVVEDCWTVDLPEGSPFPHLCVVRLGARHIEICPGEPMVLGDFDDPVSEGEDDPAEALLDADGGLAPPPRWRGQPVTAVEGWKVLGPVQPSADGVVLRDPWPEQISRACRELVGSPVSAGAIDAIWRIIHPEDQETNAVGVLKAA